MPEAVAEFGSWPAGRDAAGSVYPALLFDPAFAVVFLADLLVELAETSRDVGMLVEPGVAEAGLLVELADLLADVLVTLGEALGVGLADVEPLLVGLVESPGGLAFVSAGVTSAEVSELGRVSSVGGVLVGGLGLSEVAGGLAGRGVRPPSSAGVQVVPFGFDSGQLGSRRAQLWPRAGRDEGGQLSPFGAQLGQAGAALRIFATPASLPK